MMNFHQYDGPYLQYVQMIDSDLNILGNENGTQVDGNGNDQKYSGLCSVNNNFYLAYSSLDFSYGIYLNKYDASGVSAWSEPVNIVEASFSDNLVQAVLPNEANDGLAVVFEEASFMGTGLNMIFVDSNGQTISQMPVCASCDNPKYESHSIGDNEFVVLFTADNNQDADLYAQIFSFDGNLLGPDNGFVVSGEIRDQINSSITYSVLFMMNILPVGLMGEIHLLMIPGKKIQIKILFARKFILIQKFHYLKKLTLLQFKEVSSRILQSMQHTQARILLGGKI